jgi:hypothetical protein
MSPPKRVVFLIVLLGMDAVLTVVEAVARRRRARSRTRV